jgi:hypothetical protein
VIYKQLKKRVMKKSAISVKLSQAVNLAVSNKEVFVVLSVISVIMILVKVGYELGVIVEYSWQR